MNYNVDYHIHYHMDKCASDSMTLSNIDNSVKDLGLSEISVLKHYSHVLPNGEADWANWHVVKKEQFESYLQDVHFFKSRYGIVIHSGVESELVNENGDINIPVEDQEKLDMVALSMHYMIDFEKLSLHTITYPPRKREEDAASIAEWLEKVNTVNTEEIVIAMVNANRNAIKRFHKVKTLAHFYDGMQMLKDYLVPIEKIRGNRLVEIMEPLMHTMCEYNVMWELCGGTNERPYILARANELGVSFVPTADAHKLNFDRRRAAVELMEGMGLRKGRIDFEK